VSSPWQNAAQDSAKLGSGGGGAFPRSGRRTSCFHIAIPLRIKTVTAVP
jgi:hypothetical protein